MRRIIKPFAVLVCIAGFIAQFLLLDVNTQAEELFDRDANVTYTVEFSVDGNKINSSNQHSEELVAGSGILLAPGQQIKWVSIANDREDTTNTCHHSEGPAPMIHSESIGLKFTSASEEVSLESLGEVKTADFEIITGGYVYTDNSGTNTQTKETITVDDSFTASQYVYVKYIGAGDTHIYADKCEHNNNWNTYYYGTGARFSVQQVNVDSIDISFDTDGGLFNSNNYPTAITAGIDKSSYNYDAPIRIGYEFDGWSFEYSDGRSADSLFSESQIGTITLNGLDGTNWENIDKASRDSVKAVAQWKEKRITLRYDPNGGMTDFAYDKNVYVFEQGNIAYDPQKNNEEYFKAPYKEGYTFDGWYIGNTRVTKLADIDPDDWNVDQIYDAVARYTLVSDPGYEIDSHTRTLTIKNSSGFREHPDFACDIVNVVVNSGITEIPKEAFCRADHNGSKIRWANLASVTLPMGIKEIGQNAFYGNKHIKSLVLPDGVETIGKWAFYACGLEEITIPASLRSIDTSAFMYSENEIKVKYYGTKEEWDRLSSDVKCLSDAKVSFVSGNNQGENQNPTDGHTDGSKAEYSGDTTVKANISVGQDVSGKVKLPDIPDNMEYGVPTSEEDVFSELNIENDKLSYSFSKAISDGAKYKIKIPVIEVSGANAEYSNYTITVTLKTADGENANNETSHSSENNKNNKKYLWFLLIIPVLGIAGAVAFFVIKKRKGN